MENPRYMSDKLKAQLEIKEEKEVQEGVAIIQRKPEFCPDYKNIKQTYLKGTSINNFENYKKVIEQR